MVFIQGEEVEEGNSGGEANLPSSQGSMSPPLDEVVEVNQMEELTSDEEFVEAEEEHQPQYDSDGDEIPDVDDINIDNKNNRANCINSNIDKVLEVYDEETCMEMMRSYYEVYYEQVLGPECSCSLSGCEFDYQTNTYRLQAKLNSAKVDLATHFIVVMVDVTEGSLKVCSITE